ncbi:MAG: SDR family oxidoreductase [Bacteroidetes bacterium]|nr:SDR family oxidoreductase [Bacteroidota bacterium]
MKQFTNKVVIITGGAHGIGKASAIKFAEEGASVAIVDRDSQDGEKVAEEIRESGGVAVFFYADVSISADVQSVVESVIASFKRIDVLYNNASVYMAEDGAVADIDEDVWDNTIAINLRSVFLFSKYTIPHMLKIGGGAIINTSSSCGIIGIPNCDAYSASKGATAEITRSMAVEYGPMNIRVNCIAPAAIMTPMLSFSNLNSTSFDEERFLKLRTPLRRYGQPEEIADLAVFLASEKSSYLNGTVMVADGGITINGDLTKIDKDYL